LRSYSSIKGNEYQTIYQVLGLEANDDRLLAMIIQNETQDQNKSRVEAFQSNTYSDFLSSPQTLATESLKKQLQSLLLNKLKASEREELTKHEKLAKSNLAIKLLKAPDQFYAYALMQEHKMSFGKGDFQKIIDVLKMGYDAEYRDVGNKLLLLRNGRILRKEEKMVQREPKADQEENDDDSDSDDAAKKATHTVDWAAAFRGEEAERELEEEAAKAEPVVVPPQCAPMFADKSRPHIKSSHNTNYKHVFQIWAQHIHLHPDNEELSLEQLLDIFPEFTDRINIYDSCCNEKGQIVRNRQLYKRYKDSTHASGKRGGQKAKSNLNSQWEPVAKAPRRDGINERTGLPNGAPRVRGPPQVRGGRGGYGGYRGRGYGGRGRGG